MQEVHFLYQTAMKVSCTFALWLNELALLSYHHY